MATKLTWIIMVFGFVVFVIYDHGLKDIWKDAGLFVLSILITIVVIGLVFRIIYCVLYKLRIRDD